MISHYTETLEEYIAQGGDLHKAKFDLLPTFSVGSTSLNMYDLFITRYKLREIGAETEELFSHYLDIKLDEIMLRYVDKINLYISNFNDLMSRKVKLQQDDTTTYGKATQNEDYLNPITNGTGAKLQDFTKQVNQGSDNYHSVKEQAFGYFKSNPEILKAALEIENIYYTALEEFNILFMEVY